MTLATTRRRFMRLGVGGAGAALLGTAGCSNFSGGSGGGSSEDDFVFTFWGTGAEKTAVTKIIEDFCQGANLNPKPQSIPGDYETKLNTLLAANTPPDMGYVTESMAMRLGEQGKIVSIADKPGYDAFLPGTIHHWSADGAVNQNALEVMVFWYDSDVTSAAGVTPPATIADAWSFDTLAENADRLTVDDNGRHPSDPGFDAGAVRVYGVAAPTNLPALVALLKSNGVDLFNADGTATNIATPEAVEVLQNISDLIFKHRVSPTPAQATTFGASTALLLASKRVAMAVDGQWALLDLSQTEGLNYNAAVLPKFDVPVTTSIGGAMGLFNGSKHLDAASDLNLQLCDPSKSNLFTSGLWMPVEEKYYTDEALISTWVTDGVHPSNYRTAVIAPTLADPVPYPSYRIKNFTGTIGTTINNSLTAMFTKETDIAAAAQKLASDIEAQMQGTYPDVIS